MANNLRWVVVGNGNQGGKHREVLGSSCVGVVDESSISAGVAALDQYSTDSYDAIVISTPEHVKNTYIEYALNKKKSVLVEKPIDVDPNLLQLIEKSLADGIHFETAYDHQIDPGIMYLVEKVKSVPKEELDWSTLKINYSFGTQALIKNSPWMDFGTGPWELVAPHALRILCELDSGSDDEFLYSFGMGNLQSPSTVTAVRSGKNYVEVTTSYTSWLNTFSMNFTWEEGTLELSGLTKWGSSTFSEYKRIHPAGKPDLIEIKVFEARTPLEAVAALHKVVFDKDLSHSLACDLKIANYLTEARKQLLVWNNTP
jgi:predicted dehydrogenase